MKDRILGFDFGRKRIGTACGNRKTGTTEPLSTVGATRNGPDWQRLLNLVNEWSADELVVGLPLHMDGSESDISLAARKFGKELGNRTGLPVIMVDERLSSREAGHLLELSATPGKSQYRRLRNFKDSIAAELIVRTYLAEKSGIACSP